MPTPSAAAVGPLRGGRPGDARRDHEAAQRPDRQRGDGRRLHPGQRRQARRAARPHADRGRALHRAFPRRRRREQADQLADAQPASAGGRRVSAAPPRANRSIFYDRQRQARSVASVYRVLVGRYEVARGGAGAVRRRSRRRRRRRRANAAARSRRTPPASPRRYARRRAVAGGAAGDNRPMFHGLFRSAAAASRWRRWSVRSGRRRRRRPRRRHGRAPVAAARRTRARLAGRAARRRRSICSRISCPTRARCFAAGSDARR